MFVSCFCESSVFLFHFIFMMFVYLVFVLFGWLSVVYVVFPACTLSFHLLYHVFIAVLPCVPEQCPPMLLPMVKQGEVARMVMDTAGCCMSYEVFCKPEECTPPTLVCPPPMMLQPASPHECCPTYRCSKSPNSQLNSFDLSFYVSGLWGSLKVIQCI